MLRRTRERLTYTNVPTRLALIVVLCVGLAATFATAAHGMRTVFVSNSGSGGGIESITPFSVNSDGSLVPSPVVPTGDRPEGTAVTPDARFLYVATSVTAGVRGYAIGSGGALTEVPGSPFASGDIVTTGVAVTPSGDRLLATNRGGSSGTDPGTIAVFDINLATGALAAVTGSPFAAGLDDAAGIAIAPNGGRVFVTGDDPVIDDPRVAVFDINQATGALTAVNGSPFASGGKQSHATVVSPDGGRLFVGNVRNNLDSISVLDVNQATGALAPVAGSPFASVGRAPIGLALAPGGKRLFSAERVLISPGASTDGVAVYDIANNGALTVVAGSPFTSGGGRTEAVATTPNGQRVYGPANANPGVVEGFSIGAAGALTPLTGSPYPTGDKFAGFFSIAMTPSQMPLPSFTVTPAGIGQASTFDASSTTVPGGRATRFDWDFGDGTTLPNGGPTPQHSYGSPGTYTVGLTVTNDCSFAAGFVGDTVFTGQTAHCNGSPQATTTRTLTVADRTLTVVDTSAPTITLAGKKTQTGSKLVKVKVTSDEAATVEAKGTIKVPVIKGGKSAATAAKKKKSRLKKQSKEIAAGATVTLKLKLKKQAKKLTRKAQKKGKKPRAKLTVSAVDGAGNEASAKRKVKLKRKRK
jgi:DNA-binding beta-propeller fold protein YncE